MSNAWALGAGSGDSTSSKFSKRFKNFSRSQIAESYWIISCSGSVSHIHQPLLGHYMMTCRSKPLRVGSHVPASPDSDKTAKVPMNINKKMSLPAPPRATNCSQMLYPWSFIFSPLLTKSWPPQFITFPHPTPGAGTTTNSLPRHKKKHRCSWEVNWRHAWYIFIPYS